MPSFEDSLKKLESIVDQLEKGDLALEESLKLFEEGVGLSAACKAGAGRRRGQGPDAGQAARRLAQAGAVPDRKALIGSRRLQRLIENLLAFNAGNLRGTGRFRQ
jgi:exodeoxyribonuclease VII small subunit